LIFFGGFSGGLVCHAGPVTLVYSRPNGCDYLLGSSKVVARGKLLRFSNWLTLGFFVFFCFCLSLISALPPSNSGTVVALQSDDGQ